MVFSSIPFLFYFLPIVLVLYYLSPRCLKNAVLFFSSLFFYAWGEPVYVLIMLFSTIVDYTHGLLIEKYLALDKKKKAKLVLCSSIVINLGLLCFFKYSDFFVQNLNAIMGTEIAPLHLPLPIGISFYTFQTMSYSIDVYRQEVRAQRNIISFGAYVALFPQLIAGPIVRFQTIAHALNARKEIMEDFAAGAMRFVQGLGKKVLLANNIGFLWDSISTTNLSTLPTLTAWIGLVAFAFQIYFDFSGYSDMAIGLGRMLGFSFPENFNYPYVSQSITEFWRRWHISLGVWFREYVYIPLGGNQKGAKRTLCNIMIVWFLTGFWHGASWNFILWGLYFGVLLLVEKQFLWTWLKKSPQVLRHAYALFFILIGWCIFAFDDMGRLATYFAALFGGNNVGFWNDESLYFLSSYGMIFLALLIGSTPLPKKTVAVLFCGKEESTFVGVLGAVFLCIIFLLCVGYIINSSYNPFLYFRF